MRALPREAIQSPAAVVAPFVIAIARWVRGHDTQTRSLDLRSLRAQRDVDRVVGILASTQDRIGASLFSLNSGLEERWAA